MAVPGALTAWLDALVSVCVTGKYWVGVWSCQRLLRRWHIQLRGVIEWTMKQCQLSLLIQRTARLPELSMLLMMVIRLPIMRFMLFYGDYCVIIEYHTKAPCKGRPCWEKVPFSRQITWICNHAQTALSVLVCLAWKAELLELDIILFANLPE